MVSKRSILKLARKFFEKNSEMKMIRSSLKEALTLSMLALSIVNVSENHIKMALALRKNSLENLAGTYVMLLKKTFPMFHPICSSISSDKKVDLIQRQNHHHQIPHTDWARLMILHGIGSKNISIIVTTEIVLMIRYMRVQHTSIGL
jgi:hypothetical protein